jgi:hypothetical protein
MRGAQGLWAGRDLYRATPAVIRNLGFTGLIRRTAPFSRLVRHTRGCGRSILTQIPTGGWRILWILKQSIYWVSFLLKIQCIAVCWSSLTILLVVARRKWSMSMAPRGPEEHPIHFFLPCAEVWCPHHEMTKITISNQSHTHLCHSPIGNTNQWMGVHGPLNISEVDSGAMEE